MARPEQFTLGSIWNTGVYAYDGSGNISSIGGVDGKSFTYDGLNRLKEFDYTLNSYDFGRTYGYDQYGNMKSINKNVGADSAMTYDGSNRLTDFNGYPISYDDRGNVVQGVLSRPKSFLFSGEDRMMESTDLASGETWRYAYNSAGERVVRWKDSGTQNQPTEVWLNIRDEGGQVLNDWLWLSNNGAPTFVNERDYIYGPNGMVAQMAWNGAGTLFAATDHLGHTRVLFDAAGSPKPLLDFAPFGEQIAGEPPDTTHLFTGHERDLAQTSSELDYMHARYYSPFLARFVSVDPVGGKVGSSQSWNRYSYVLNNPVKLVDPDGEQEVPATKPDVPSRPNLLSVFKGFFTNQVMLIDRSGGSEFPTASQLENLAAVAEVLEATVDVLLEVNDGQQGKHIEGHNNFIEGRSELTHSDPDTLLKRGAGTGEMIGSQKEAVDFNEPIGIYRQDGGEGVETTRGIIHYGQDGAHIVPAPSREMRDLVGN
jgi:RHS repeat-associated protein